MLHVAHHERLCQMAITTLSRMTFGYLDSKMKKDNNNNVVLLRASRIIATWIVIESWARFYWYCLAPMKVRCRPSCLGSISTFSRLKIMANIITLAHKQCVSLKLATHSCIYAILTVEFIFASLTTVPLWREWFRWKVKFNRYIYYLFISTYCH